MAVTLPESERMDFKDLEIECAHLSVGGLAITATEIGYLDGLTLGTQAASKAVTTDANVNSGISKVTELHLGATGAEQQWDFSTEIVTTTNVITAAENGKTFVLDSATAFVSTLPVAAAGLKFKFYVGDTIVTGGNHTIIPNAAQDNLVFGQLVVAGAVVLGTVEGSVNLIADLTLPGDWVEFFCDGTNWFVSGQIQTAAGATFTT